MEKNEIMAVEQGEQQDLVVKDEQFELAIERADRLAETLNKVLGIATRRTNPTDWVDQQGKPYLTASGAEKIMGVFGVSMKDLKTEREDREDDKGRYYIYTMMATFFWKGGSIEAIGTRSTRDKFFAWDSYKKEWKALSEVDERDIKTACYSNLMVNGVTRLLGIRSLTWEMLEQFGVKRGSSASINYKKPPTQTHTPTAPKPQEEVRPFPTPQKKTEAPTNLITDKQFYRLKAIIKGTKCPKEEFKKWAKDNFGIGEDLSKIDKKDYDQVCNYLEDYGQDTTDDINDVEEVNWGE